ncbi:UNVERIFIED_CONTAM: COP1-interacting protein 7 [Sesamum radiatum]|uniref:COP1-interacting protein 7 n=1 Tax=Sesamum radiatum TaxID=300843 RepID=A0AAW2S8P3_SESRA
MRFVYHSKQQKRKIASGLLNPFLAHLKAAQDQIAKGGYSILLEPETDVDAAWFTKATMERFVRFVSTPEILERVYTIETEILQIEEAIAMQSNNDVGQSIVEDHQEKPPGGCEANKSVPDANEEKAIVLYKPGAPLPETNGSCSEEGNSKVQLLKVLETRKRLLQKEQGMAFARAAAAGFDIDHVALLVSFAECFGALRLLEACFRFMDLWKSKHETGEWLDIDASEALSTRSDFSAMNASDNPAPNGQQEYFQGQFPHIVFPPWPMHALPGAQPAFQAIPVQGIPYYQNYAGNGAFLQPPHHPMEHSWSNLGHQSGQKMQSHDGGDSNTGSEICELDRTKSLDDADAEVSRKNENFETDDRDMIHQNNKRYSKIKGDQLKSLDKLNFSNDEVSNSRKDTDDGHWQAFQSCLLRGSDEDVHGDNKSMFAMEKDVIIKRGSNTVIVDPLELGARDTGEIQDTRMSDISRFSGSTSCRPRGSDDDAIFYSVDNDFRGSNDQMHIQFDETNGSKIVSRSMSIDQDGQADRTAIDVDSEIPISYKKLDSEGNRNRVYYEPDDFSLMPERETEKGFVGYDPALDYEMQVCVESKEQGGKDVSEVKEGLRKSDKDRRSKVTSDSLHRQRTGGPSMKGKTLKMSPSEDARVRAERLRSYKADLQRMKKEKEEAEMKRLEGLKLERQKRIAARGNSASGKSSVLPPQTKQFPAKLSPATNRGSKFSDSDPGSSSPLQRSKVRTSLGSTELLKASKSSKLSEVSHMRGNRLTRSSSSLSETKRESNGATPDSKAPMARIRRLSEPKSVTSPVTSVKDRSAEAVSRRKLSEGPDKNKISAIINLDKSKAATLPELKIKTSTSHINASENISSVEDQKVNGIKPSTFCVNAELNVSNCNTAHQTDADDNTIVEKTVVMLEYEKPSLYSSEGKSEVTNQRYDDGDTGEKSDVIFELAPIHEPGSPMHGVDGDPKICQLQEQLDTCNEVRTVYQEQDPHNCANITVAEKPYRDVSTHNSSVEDPCTDQASCGKAPQVSSEMVARVEIVKAHASDIKTLNKNPVVEKTLSKEPSKGLRRLLKFGKKNHTSSYVDQSFDSECTSIDGTEHDDNARNTASISEVGTLKNLIWQDDTPAAGNASQKSKCFDYTGPVQFFTLAKILFIIPIYFSFSPFLFTFALPEQSKSKETSIIDSQDVEVKVLLLFV